MQGNMNRKFREKIVKIGMRALKRAIIVYPLVPQSFVLLKKI